ncbi:uncharacterized protein HVO_A0242 (plasmid) [Haloferax volcanii DS2]|jgi:hypothetical protein|uniref:Uncharacterized protein n=1 Tax=Haloferax volcanii (strain ATCC 29605 / DSM 3757 / JCM 8879 / NBRC 14742 / NCIMB 2012 / VKM B-1768 / DS2) TaxID=309800 RepID=D4GQS1_HALVD|nr:uncharacterized protein HVO_A0242 [Haloferax volcanii DS2]
MNRRKLLLSLGATSLAFPGCLGKQTLNGTDDESSSDPNNTSKSMCDDLNRLQITCEGPENSAFDLSIPRSPSSIGEELQVQMTNSTEKTKYSGNRFKYDIQKKTDQRWQSIFWVHARPAWSDEAVEHKPGAGFTWEFEFTQGGLSRQNDTNPDYYVCNSLSEGRYRFVYFGYDTRCIAAEFMI